MTSANYFAFVLSEFSRRLKALNIYQENVLTAADTIDRHCVRLDSLGGMVLSDRMMFSFLMRLARILPDTTTPVLAGDDGLKVDLVGSVEKFDELYAIVDDILTMAFDLVLPFNSVGVTE